MIGVKNIIPNLIFAYAIMEFLNITNLMDIIEIVFRPFMTLLGLPGSAAPAILMGYLTTSGGLGIVVSLATDGIITAKQVAMLLSGIMCVGASIQYIGRVLATTGIKNKYYPCMLVVSTINAIIAITIARIIL